MIWGKFNKNPCRSFRKLHVQLGEDTKNITFVDDVCSIYEKMFFYFLPQ